MLTNTIHDGITAFPILFERPNQSITPFFFPRPAENPYDSRRIHRILKHVIIHNRWPCPFQHAVGTVGDVGPVVRRLGQLQGAQVVAEQVPDQRVGRLLRDIRGQLHGQHRGVDRFAPVPERSSGLQRP